MGNNLPSFDSFAGQLMIATQCEGGHLFYQSVVLITEHNLEIGSVGYIINHPFDTLSPKEIFRNRDITHLGNNFQLMRGGPVDMSHGAILHTDDYHTIDTHPLDNHLALTETQQILDDISNQEGPQHFLALVGKSVWEAGQLEEEIMNNMWIPIPFSFELIFKTPNNKKWQEALATLKIDANLLAHQAGKA